MPRRYVSTTIAPVFDFDAPARREGSKRGLRITIPARIIRGLYHLGWSNQSPLVLRVGDAVWSSKVRRMGASVVVTLPKKHRANIEAGDIVHIRIARSESLLRGGSNENALAPAPQNHKRQFLRPQKSLHELEKS